MSDSEVVVSKKKRSRPLLNPEDAEPRKRKTKFTGAVVFFKNLPIGLFEPQLRKFLSQFGEVTRIRISKSRKTGHSRGYGWAEFKHAEVAKIVADTMNNYILGDNQIITSYLERKEIHSDTFRNWNKKFKHVPWKKIAVEQSAKTAESVTQTAIVRMIAKEKLLEERFTELGIDFKPISLETMFPDIAQKVGEIMAAEAEVRAEAESESGSEEGSESSD